MITITTTIKKQSCGSGQQQHTTFYIPYSFPCIRLDQRERHTYSLLLISTPSHWRHRNRRYLITMGPFFSFFFFLHLGALGERLKGIVPWDMFFLEQIEMMRSRGLNVNPPNSGVDRDEEMAWTRLNLELTYNFLLVMIKLPWVYMDEPLCLCI